MNIELKYIFYNNHYKKILTPDPFLERPTIQLKNRSGILIKGNVEK